jgi:hypothetical protein
MKPLCELAPWENYSGPELEERVELPPEPEPVARPEPVVVTLDVSDRRRGCLRFAGVENERLVETIATGPAFCPALPGHEGSHAAVEAVAAFLARPELATLVLAGKAGRGKTYAAIYPLAHPSLWDMAKHKVCQFLHASRVTVGDRWTAKRDACIDAHLLVVDDLGRESGDWASDQVLSLILDRHDNGRKTIITTNLRRSSKVVSPEQAAQYRNQFMDLRYTDSLMSRLSDPTATRFVVCKGDDIRPTHTQESAE